jgi:hypothetical protein
MILFTPMRKILMVSWQNLDGPKGSGRGMARCELLRTRKSETVTGKAFLEARIRDPKGRLWWDAISCAPKRQQGSE